MGCRVSGARRKCKLTTYFCLARPCCLVLVPVRMATKNKVVRGSTKRLSHPLRTRKAREENVSIRLVRWSQLTLPPIVSSARFRKQSSYTITQLTSDQVPRLSLFNRRQPPKPDFRRHGHLLVLRSVYRNGHRNGPELKRCTLPSHL